MCFITNIFLKLPKVSCLEIENLAKIVVSYTYLVAPASRKKKESKKTVVRWF